MIEVAVLKNFNGTTYKAGVQLAGSLTTYFDDIAVATNIPASAMVPGNYVIVATPGDNPKDACVIATWPAGTPGGGMEEHGNEYHDPDFEQEGVAAVLVEAHRTTAEHTQPQPSNFLKLSDSPSTYSGQGGKLPRVKSDESGLEFNTRIQPRISSSASGNISPDVSSYDYYIRTAQAAAITINNPTGSPVQGEKIIIRLKDNGTARAISWGSQYRALEFPLPATTVLGKTLYLGFAFNSTDTKWDLLAINQEA
jgi:hypothetical protein